MTKEALDSIINNSEFSECIKEAAPYRVKIMQDLTPQMKEVQDNFLHLMIDSGHNGIKSIMDKLNTKFWFSTMQDASDEDYTEHMQDMIQHVSVPIIAKLGDSSISVLDFVNLQIGDVIRLSSKVDDEMDIYVGNIRKFKALPGATKKLYAVRVTEIIREEEE